MDLDAVLDVPELGGTRWSVEVLDGDGAPLAERDATTLLPTASLGKTFLLVEVAARLAAGTLDPHDVLDRRTTTPVADSGLWQHLAVDALPLADLAVLVGAVSDNLATNALLDVVGLEQVRRRATSLAPGGSTLHDQVRTVRGQSDPATLSEGCARDHASLFHGLARGQVVSPGVSDQVLAWLATGADLSMVAGAFDLDPLAHPRAGRVALAHKTGTDDGIRADAGTVTWRGSAASYAAICRWDAEVECGDGLGRTAAVLAAMRRIGVLVREVLRG